MALSNLEGCTIGGLDEGRGHNTRILAFKGTVTADISATSVHSVTKDGVVTDTSAGDATLSLGYGHGLTLEIPALAADAPAVATLTFGQVSTTGPTADSQHMNIQVASVNVVNVTASGDDIVLPAGVSSISGDQIEITIGDATDGGVNVDIADSDQLVFNVIAFATMA